MLGSMYTSSTLAFDTFGDIELENEDLKINWNLKAILQILADFLKSNYGDYMFHERFGANYDRFIGKGIDDTLVREVVSSIKYDITSLDIIPSRLLNVYGLANGHVLEVRIILAESEDYTIYLNIDTVKGVSIGY